jgi:hypothetical protein
MHATIDRIGNRAKRELIAKFPPATRWAESKRAAEVAAHRSRLTPLDEQRRAQVAAMEEDGAIVGPWNDLDLPGTDDLKPILERFKGMLAERPVPASENGSMVALSRAETLEDPRLFQWGLQDEVLDLVEHYLGVPAHYYGALVRREVADSRIISTRQWHRDIEDYRNLKILVWLNDVDADGGPFTYVPLATSQEAVKELRYVGGYVSDDRFAAVVPRSEWQQATGPQWTAVMADNCRLFHRAQAPVARDRYSVTFTWIARKPLKVMPDEAWLPADVVRATAGLGPRQLAALPPSMRR